MMDTAPNNTNCGEIDYEEEEQSLIQDPRRGFYGEMAKRSPKRGVDPREVDQIDLRRGMDPTTTASSDEDFVQVQSGVDESHPDYPLQVMEGAQGKNGVVA